MIDNRVWKLLAGGALVTTLLSGAIQWSHSDTVRIAIDAQAKVDALQVKLEEIRMATAETNTIIKEAQRRGDLGGR